MDLIYPQSGIAIPGKESRSVVLCPVPDKKVIDIQPFSYINEIANIGAGIIIAPDLGENNVYFVDINLFQTNNTSSPFILAYDFAGNPVTLGPNRSSFFISDTDPLPVSDYKKLTFRQLDISGSMVGGATVTVVIQGYQLTLEDL